MIVKTNKRENPHNKEEMGRERGGCLLESAG